MEFVFVKKLVDEWVKMGHRCVVISEFPIQTYIRKRCLYKPEYYRDDVTSELFVDVYNPRIVNIPGAGKLNYIWGRFNSQIAFSHLMNRLNIKFDFFYCHFFVPSLIAFMYAKRYSIPFFVATGESSIPVLRMPCQSFTLSEFRSYTSGVIAVSNKNKEEATARQLINPEKCKIFPNGTDLNVFLKKDKLSCRRQLGFSENDFIVICVGSFSVRKGQDKILKAIDKLNRPDLKLVLLGEPAVVDGLFPDSKYIIFQGSVPNSQLPVYLNASDVFCLPTQREGCCNAIVEAMACGLPIVSSDRSFNYDILNRENSILIDPDDVDEIANALDVLYKDEMLRDCLASNAFIDSRRLGVRQRADDILDFIESRIGG